MSIVLFTVIDLETSGLAPPASVIEIGWCHLYLDTDTKAVEIGLPQSRLFSPAEPLTPENIAVHHLTDDMLAGLERCTDDDLAAVANENAPQFLVAANCAFERLWVRDDLLTANLKGAVAKWICTVKAAARLYPEAESHSNQAIRYRLGLDLPEHLAMPPHRAGPDAYVTAHILGRFIEQGAMVRDLVKWTTEPRFMTGIKFGKHKGTAWADLPLDYLQWCGRQTDMDADALHWIRAELERRRDAA